MVNVQTFMIWIRRCYLLLCIGQMLLQYRLQNDGRRSPVPFIVSKKLVPQHGRPCRAVMEIFEHCTVARLGLNVLQHAREEYTQMILMSSQAFSLYAV